MTDAVESTHPFTKVLKYFFPPLFYYSVDSMSTRFQLDLFFSWRTYLKKKIRKFIVKRFNTFQEKCVVF